MHPDPTDQHISPAPRFRRGSHVPYLTLAALLTAAVAYGSLLPLDFRLPRDPDLARFLTGVFHHPAWQEATPDDLITNVLLYFPIGVLVGLGLWRRGAARLTQLLGAILVAALASYTCETLQGLMPRRVSSLTDLMLNTLGGGVGALLSFRAHALLRFAWFACRGLWHAFSAAGARWMNRSAMRFARAVAGLMIFGWMGAVWWIGAAQMSGRPTGGVNWVPLLREFGRPYGEALPLLLLRLAAACGMALGWAMILDAPHRRGQSMIWIVTASLGAAAAGIEWVRFQHSAAEADITGPFLVVGAAFLCLGMGRILMNLEQARSSQFTTSNSAPTP